MENLKSDKNLDPRIKEGTGLSRHDEKDKRVDDGFKTSDKKYFKQEWAHPLEEQQFDYRGEEKDKDE